jgi:hypothetical protein
MEVPCVTTDDAGAAFKANRAFFKVVARILLSFQWLIVFRSVADVNLVI